MSRGIKIAIACFVIFMTIPYSLMLLAFWAMCAAAMYFLCS